MSFKTNRDTDIAVVGASALYPGSIGGASFWNNILAGRDFMSDIPADHWLIDDYYDPDPKAPGKIYAKRGAFLPKIDFDPIEYGLPPKQLTTTDTAQLLGLLVAQKVLDDAASVQFNKVDKRNISVILGVASATEMVGQMAARIQRPHWVKALRDAGLPESQVQEICGRIEDTYPEWDESTFPGLLGNVVAGRIANRLNLGGTNCVIDAACASSLGAVAMAVQELQLGHADLVITGGADALNDTFMFMCFSKTPALSPTGDCRPFAEAADGTMLGEGIGMVALRRLADAERDSDKIYAVLRGIGSSSDGRAKSIYAPRAEGQEIAIRRAYERAGYSPEEVGLIEAHGTATPAGDIAEFSGLCRAFSDIERSDRQWCALGSVKSQIGHTKAAAGAAALFKVVMALHHKVLPPTIKVDKPNAKLQIETSPFYLNTLTRPWIHAPGKTRKASVSSFGFGGSNFHVTLEEYTGQQSTARRYSNLPLHLLLIGAENAAALIAKAKDIRAQLAGEAYLPALARETQLAFSAQAAYRLALVSPDAPTAMADLDMAAGLIAKAGEQAFSLPNRMHYGIGGKIGKIAFLFPGQGSQYINMGAALAIEFDAARRVWDEAAALELDAEQRLHEVVFPIPVFNAEDRDRQTALLTRTDWAQPAIGATSLSMLKLLDRLGVKPEATAGHSYGEISALYAAGVISTPENLLNISRKRGELMNAAASSTPGAMMAVRAGAQKLELMIAEHNVADITVANINSPNQVVVAGPITAIDDFQSLLQTAQIQCHRLPVATAFHTELVAGCAAPFGQFLAGLQLNAPLMPVYGNTDAAPYAKDPDRIRGTLARHLDKPVRFAETVTRMCADGYRIFVEVGPGSVLTGMVRDCLAGENHIAVALDGKKLDGRAGLVNVLGVLSANGIAVDYGAFWDEFAPFEPVTNSGKLSAASVKLNGSNYGKPYPPEQGASARPKPNPERPEAAPAAKSVPQTEPAPTQAVVDQNWPAAFQAMQQQTLEAQKAFTQALSESHQAFLRASEAAFIGLGQSDCLSVQALPVHAAQQAVVPMATPAAAPPAVDAAPEEVAVIAPHIDHQALLLEVVADKTGYPVAMLTLDMELEAGLGIDSIKRVEILSVLQEKIPQLAQINIAQLAALNTLGEIVDFAAKAAPAAVPTAAIAPHIDHQALLLEVVADKTGYPVAMLTLDMELEAGLGIDSIKRVEILSVLQEKIPQLAQINIAQLAALNTLGEIVDFAAKAAPAAVPTAAIAPHIDHQALLLEVVADKTGYPVAMLTLDMELEAGLGIDSIKRVEILSVLQEKIPQLAQINIAQLAALNTLGEIVDFAAKAAPSTAAVAALAPMQVPNSLRRLAVTIEQAPASGLVMPGLLEADPLYLVASDPGIASVLAGKLKDAGVSANVVTAPPADARSVLMLSALDPVEAGAQVQAGLNEAVFRHLQACAETMSTQGRLLVTVQSTGGDFGIGGSTGERAWSAGIVAAAKTAVLEWPQVSVKAIDIETGGLDNEAIANALFIELFTGGAQLEVGLKADGSRLSIVAVEQCDSEPVAVNLSEHGVIVVTGGARGVTAHCLIELLSRVRTKIAILGRTTLRDEPGGLEHLTTDAQLKQALLQRYSDAGQTVSPQQLGAEVRELMAQRELKSNLDKLAALGSEVRYYAADVGDGKAVADAITTIRDSFGPICGLIHAAGVVADKEIKSKTFEQFQRVLRTKVDGFRYLLDATRQDALTHIACFSSVAARRGNAGQIDYAMANEVLNRVCRAEQAQRGNTCLVKAIGWGPWAGGMVDPGLEKHFAAMGVALIPLDEGARLFADEFTGRNGDAVEIVFGGGLDNFGALPGTRSQTQIFEVRFHRGTYPYLSSHIIRDVPVVPMVTVNDLAQHAAQALLPGAVIAGTANLRVIKGIRLMRFDSTGDVYRIECRANQTEQRVGVRVLDPDGILHYTVDVLLDEPTAKQDFSADAALALLPWQPNSGVIYDGRLFHGPDLQVIENLQGLCEAGCAGLLQTRSSRRIGFNVDIDVLDGGLQLAVLWVHEHLGCESLPTGMDAFYLHRPWPESGAVFCEARCDVRSELVTKWTLLYRTAEGELLSSIHGLSIHLLPGAGSTPSAKTSIENV
ncbi:SDR family oxidoreductase [Methylobacter sp.]|uniref:SDR family oxidoreductase n=1 Tax=Methylobacter sp. TaxID=2051955 RepID=UPI002FE2D3E3